MNPILKTILYVVSIFCFIFAGLSIYHAVTYKVTYYDYIYAESVDMTIDEWVNYSIMIDFIFCIIALFVGVGIIVGINHYEKKKIEENK